MHRVLLVDDESLSLRGLEALIDWSRAGCEVAGTAMSAPEALAAMPAVRPDIVITDLVMPEMDGMALIETLKRDHLEVEVIILSGHGEFGYAKQAIRNSVCEFLVKPVTEEELEDALRRVGAKIEDRRRQEGALLRQRELLDESFPLLRSQYMLDILRGNVTDRQEIERMLSVARYRFAPTGAMAVLCRDDSTDVMLTGPMLKEFCEGIFENKAENCVLVDGGYLCLALGGLEGPDCGKQAQELMERLRSRILSELSLSVTIGLSPCFSGLEGAPDAYRWANDAATSRFFLGQGRVIAHHASVERRQSGRYPFEKTVEILNRIQYQQELDAGTAAAELVDFFVDAAGYHIDVIQKYCQQFRLRLMELLHGLSGNPGLDDGGRFEQPTLLMGGAETLGELRGSLADVIAWAAQTVDGIRRRKAGSIVERAKQYIADHLAGDVTLNTVASTAYINPAYFSILFKQSAGMNFHDYVIGRKMDHARRLLIEDRMKIYEVAGQVGYQNYRSFSDAFKRHWGATPSEYVKDFFSKRLQ